MPVVGHAGVAALGVVDVGQVDAVRVIGVDRLLTGGVVAVLLKP